MTLFLQRYNFTVMYSKGSLHLADTLSRAPCQDLAAAPMVPDTFQVFIFQVFFFRLHLAHPDPVSPALTASTHEQLHRATASRQDIKQLTQYIVYSWRQSKQQILLEL